MKRMMFVMACMLWIAALSALPAPVLAADGVVGDFLYGTWVVDQFLGFDAITKDDAAWPDGEKVIGKTVIITRELFSTKDFGAEYEKYAVEIQNPLYSVADTQSGEVFSLYLWRPTADPSLLDLTDEVVTLINTVSTDGEETGPTLYAIDDNRLLLSLNCDYFELRRAETEANQAETADAAAQTAVWTANVPRVAIYDDPQGIGVYEVEYHAISSEEVGKGERVRLLMINGGFVPDPGIVIENGRTLVPVRVISECLGATVVWNDTERTVAITGEDTDIRFTVGSADAQVNGLEETLDTPSRIIGSSTYVPLRFIAEALHASVQYIPKLNYDVDVKTQGSWRAERDYVSVAVIEKPQRDEKAHTVEEGLAEVKKASAQTYAELLLSMEAIGNTFHSAQPDYDSQAVRYAGFDLGRYAVYQLEGFETFPILFNRYTGEIYSEKAGLPFTHIEKGFINISWIYQ